MTQFEQYIIRKRKALIKRSKAMFVRAIKEQYLSALHIIENHSIDHASEMIREAVKREPIEKAFVTSYISSVDIALLWRNKLLNKKDAIDDLYKNVFMDNMSRYARNVAGSRITDITGTTKDRIVEVIQAATTEAVSSGVGIDKTRNLIIDAIRQDYEDFTGARAQRIAQTEMITASNQATMDGAKSTGYEFRKFWSTSGLPNVRDSHRACEEESINSGGLQENNRFANGLLFPGDPAGGPEEVINCHCTLLTELVI
jgi:hypothetical protein